MQLDFSIILDWLPAFGSALLVTLKTTVFSLILGLVISVPLSLCKISTFKPLQWFAFFYTSVFRGVPLLVQVFMMYFGIPLVLPVRFTAFQAGTLVFAMNSAAYISESLKGGIGAIDIGQYEAAMALGVHYPSMMKDIILPQAIKSVLPSLVNEFISLLKKHDAHRLHRTGGYPLRRPADSIAHISRIRAVFRHFGVLLCAGAGAFHLGQGA